VQRLFSQDEKLIGNIKNVKINKDGSKVSIIANQPEKKNSDLPLTSLYI